MIRKLLKQKTSPEQVLTLCAVAVAAPALGGLFPEQGWVLELCAQFKTQYFILLSLLAATLLLRKKWVVGAVAAIFAVVNLAQIAPFYLGGPAPGPGAFRAILLNVHGPNNEIQLVIDLIRKERPDFVALLEIDNKWRNGLVPT